MTALPKCPKCNSEFTYEDGDNYVCPECAHEWPKNAPAEAGEEKRVVKDAFGTVLNDGDSVTDCADADCYTTDACKPGKGDEWEDLWKTYTKPIYDKLVADGSIFGFGVDTEYIHTEDPGWRAIWVVTTGLGAFDKVDAAFRAAFEARSEAEREAIGARFRSLTEPSEHRDGLWRSVSLQ